MPESQVPVGGDEEAWESSLLLDEESASSQGKLGVEAALEYDGAGGFIVPADIDSDAEYEGAEVDMAG